MSSQLIYVLTSIFMLVLLIFLDLKYDLLRDSSISANKPYSYARSQLAWWTYLILSAIIAIVWSTGKLPNLFESTLILLGIGSLTTVAARLIDFSDNKQALESATVNNLSQNQNSEGFILDILSDKDGVSIHRLQAVLFNVIFGLWFVYEVFQNIKGANVSTLSSSHTSQFQKDLALIIASVKDPEALRQLVGLKTNYASAPTVDKILPDFDKNNLILMGLSAGTYTALKISENK